MIFYAFLMFYVVTTSIDAQNGTDYCDPSLCNGLPHIGCGATNEFSSNCPNDAEMMIINEEQQVIIVEEMNFYRHYIAGGGNDNYEPACRMATMQWDNELAYLASLNVKKCEMEMDHCHNTPKFKSSGQNVYLLSGTFTDGTKNLITEAIEFWFIQMEDTNMSKIKEIPDNLTPIETFSAIVNEKNTHIGCAASTYSNEDKRFFLFTCNFATHNSLNTTIYEGCIEVAIKCRTGTNPTYTNLCSTSETYEEDNSSEETYEEEDSSEQHEDTYEEDNSSEKNEERNNKKAPSYPASDTVTNLAKALIAEMVVN